MAWAPLVAISGDEHAAVYFVIGLPPSSSGAVNETFAFAPEGTALTSVGAPGADVLLLLEQPATHERQRQEEDRRDTEARSPGVHGVTPHFSAR